VVAAPALRRAGWIGGAALAAIAIIALAAHGRRPDPGLVRFRADGVMAEVPPERVSEVVVSRGERRWRFAKVEGHAWTRAAGMAALDEETRVRLERGLHFLHVSGPERVMTRDELAGTPLADLGLDPPRFTVSVRAGGTGPITVEFGALNPQGLSQYARVRGRSEIVLLPSFVGEPWGHVVDGPR
jgi:hypothetical protein